MSAGEVDGRGSTSGPLSVAHAADVLPGRGINAWRVALIAVGLGLMGMGGLLLFIDVPPEKYLGIVTWIVVALVIHDGVIAPIVVAIGLGAVRLRVRIAGPGRPGRVAFAIAQGALLTGAVLTIVTIPALVSKALGARNPTVLLGEYALALAIVWVIVAVVATGAIVWSRYGYFATSVVSKLYRSGR